MKCHLVDIVGGTRTCQMGKGWDKDKFLMCICGTWGRESVPGSKRVFQEDLQSLETEVVLQNFEGLWFCWAAEMLEVLEVVQDGSFSTVLNSSDFSHYTLKGWKQGQDLIRPDFFIETFITITSDLKGECLIFLYSQTISIAASIHRRTTVWKRWAENLYPSGFSRSYKGKDF